MSRIGKQPIAVPAEVKVQVAGGKVTVEGKKGAKLEFAHHPNMVVKFDAAAKAITVNRPDDDRLNRALHGLTRSLIANMVEGVTKGYEKRLKIEGLGYSAKLDKKSIVLTVGYANAIKLDPPEGVTVEIADKDGTVIVVKGRTSKRLASSPRKFEPPASQNRIRAKAFATKTKTSAARKASLSPGG